MGSKRLLITAGLMLIGAIGIAALDAEVNLSPIAALVVTLAVVVPIMLYATWDQLTGKPQ